MARAGFRFDVARDVVDGERDDEPDGIIGAAISPGYY